MPKAEDRQGAHVSPSTYFGLPLQVDIANAQVNRTIASLNMQAR